jgi:hypothetical protein
MKEILLHSLGFKVNPRFNSASTYGGSFICRSLKFPGPGVGLSVHRFYSTSSSGSNTIIYLAESRRSYSTLRKNEQFWRKVNSRDLSDLDNPFIIVNNFFKKYPTKDLAKPHINLDLIHSILTRHIFNFELTSKTFNFLNEISPIRLELPASSSKLAEYVGNYSSKGESKKGGVYVFTNKLNGFCYVGSSISLSTRLNTGYLGPVLGNRVVDLAIKDTGLENFYLDLYIIPQDLLNLFIKEVSSNDSNVVELEKNKLKFLTLALEQMLIL